MDGLYSIEYDTARTRTPTTTEYYYGIKTYTGLLHTSTFGTETIMHV
jgi:hypothetical protein